MKFYESHRLALFFFLSILPTVIPLAPVSTSQQPPPLQVVWDRAKLALAQPDCCVVTIPGMETHLDILQSWLTANGAHQDLDCRALIRTTCYASIQEDCLALMRQCVPGEVDTYYTITESGDQTTLHNKDVTASLEELARGVASFANDHPIQGVHMRIVCASNYNARDPPFHTDKCPLRAYVTLVGLGTEIVTRTCSPIEYATLRMLGKLDVSLNNSSKQRELRRADEMEFIVMKGDHFYSFFKNPAPFLNRVWKRASACVHRSPPGMGGQRIILSLDLADGDDDREWCETGKKRKWRNGMTQRKSRLVA